ncbi:GumC family protein [Vibrio genomosp. F10]|uniref:Chain-length determining protein n=1 Tax=Vibrio genomosp. F10 TaxID=723171 RepID=A0A1B9QZP9_9VIBR|nr:GNVR domain-containing protein [Vibrio genomosp. F10]OCH76589.1 chain-length determining protein [Vibrio genomosp. F10]OEE93398.1 chain-length determining protein [Vibrio genomosp. F10 str. 9ZC157]OEE95429.1 chain-length determining protein [Vibrio genomosp. F10 str. 9ZD137]OEF05650.1 chain-length determining protein [Vibrio genomosp. F10 str. 9ZB36]
MNELKYRLIVIFSAAWRRRYLICLPIVILPFVGAIVSQLAPTSYRSHTSMLIQETAKMNPFLEDLAVSTMLKDRLNALSTLLKSRHVLNSVALEQGLIDENSSPSDIDKVMYDISKSLTVTQLGKDFLKIELESKESEGMKELLQSISDHFIEQLLAPERSSIKDSSEFLAFHIEKRQNDLDLAEDALADFKNDNSSVSPELQSQSLTRLAVLKQSLAEKQAELAGVKKSLGSLDDQLSRTNPVVGKIEEQIIEIRSELSSLKARYTESHSAVQAKNRELSRLESERSALLNVEQPNLNSDQLWDIASTSTLTDLSTVQPLLVTQLHSLQMVRSQFESLSEETKSLKQMIFELEQKANNFGDNAKALYRLQRDVQIKRQLYDELVERYEMAQLTGSLGVFEENKRVKIIDLPYTPSRPSNLAPVFFILAGLIAGIALGCGLATVTELFDTSIRRKDQLEDLTGIPVITIIPKVGS